MWFNVTVNKNNQGEGVPDMRLEHEMFLFTCIRTLAHEKLSADVQVTW